MSIKDEEIDDLIQVALIQVALDWEFNNLWDGSRFIDSEDDSVNDIEEMIEDWEEAIRRLEHVVVKMKEDVIMFKKWIEESGLR